MYGLYTHPHLAPTHTHVYTIPSIPFQPKFLVVSGVTPARFTRSTLEA